ncbi:MULTISPECIES: hypothetical protein [unclassified Pseudomonas]|uniref:hypothetical protein n=1 Tax=unclassified Pseudomonas TaxID=196821 RepID=UPI001CBBE185|nr:MULTISPECIES: hypothetical protein [unclassified Pseudomonas]
MQWFFWILGLVIYFVFRDPSGNVNWLYMGGLVLVIAVFSAIGKSFQEENERKKQEVRDREANEVAKELLKDINKNDKS